MWAGSIGLVAGVIGIVALALALAVLASPLFAVAAFVVAFGAFLVWRGRQRSRDRLDTRYGRNVPTTEEAAADPVADSSVPDVARTTSDAQTR